MKSIKNKILCTLSLILVIAGDVGRLCINLRWYHKYLLFFKAEAIA